ncbi:MAG: redoxin domain-containing protein [Sulfurovum sp.]|nr:redoxin domain-containing protein [Sulfurovum sp.]
MNLKEEIKKMQEEFSAQIPQEVSDIMQKSTEALIQSGIEEHCLKVGDEMPVFTLPNAMNEPISSDMLLKDGPLVINFYRGGWCPYCNLELKAFQDVLPQIKELGAQLVAISPNLPDKSLSSIEKHALGFQVLSDVQNKVSRQFGLVYTLDVKLQPLYTQMGIDLPEFNGDESYELPLPATYVVDSKGIIKLAFAPADYTQRLDPNKVIEILKGLR